MENLQITQAQAKILYDLVTFDVDQIIEGMYATGIMPRWMKFFTDLIAFSKSALMKIKRLFSRKKTTVKLNRILSADDYIDLVQELKSGQKTILTRVEALEIFYPAIAASLTNIRSAKFLRSVESVLGYPILDMMNEYFPFYRSENAEPLVLKISKFALAALASDDIEERRLFVGIDKLTFEQTKSLLETLRKARTIEDLGKFG